MFMKLEMEYVEFFYLTYLKIFVCYVLLSIYTILY